MDSVEELCGYYLGFLRGLALLHQNHHWTTKGKEFYGNHLLFERLYNAVLEDVDAAAEKFVGLFGEDTLDIGMQAKTIQMVMVKFSQGGLIESSLRAEKEFLELAQHTYDTLEKEDKLSMGLDNMLQDISDRHEESTYLLGQVRTDNAVDRVVARTSILKRIRKQAAKA